MRRFGDKYEGFRLMKMEMAGCQKYLSIFTRLQAVTFRTEVLLNYFNCGHLGYVKTPSGDCQCLAENNIVNFPEVETRAYISLFVWISL